LCGAIGIVQVDIGISVCIIFKAQTDIAINWCCEYIIVIFIIPTANLPVSNVSGVDLVVSGGVGLCNYIVWFSIIAEWVGGVLVANCITLKIVSPLI